MTKINQKLQTTLQTIKEKYNINDVYFGSGYDIYKPCIIVSYDYTIFVYPEGQGYSKKYEIYSL